MSGICGFIDWQGALASPEAALRGMDTTLARRGPEGVSSGVYNRAGLSIRWLGSADPAAPVANEDSSLRLVCDGTILNATELRIQLEQKGHHFSSALSWEVVLHAYEEFGTDAFARLQGVFALALLDTKASRIVIARDRVGEKPLFYADTPALFAFGSEPKALLACPGIDRTLDPVGLQQYLLYGCVMNPRSIFRSMRKLPEGHFAVVENGALSPPKPFWRYVFPDPPERRPETEWLDDIDAALQRSVARRLVGTEPPGAFLSGGIDSSLVVAHMCRALPPERVKTFSIALDDPAYDESRWSRWAAQIMRTDHHEFRLSPRHMIDVLDSVVGSLDEPMGDSSIIPTHVVSALTRTHVAAALAGDAGDELFGGYPKYFAQRWAAVLAHVPAPLRRWCIEMPLRLLPSPDGSVLLGQNKIAAFFRSIDQDYAVRSHLWVAAFLPDQIAELIGSPFTQDALEPVLRRAAEYQGPDDIVTKSMFLDFKLLLLDGSNVKTDRASSLAGLELREPFMDTEVIELAARIPSQFKVKRLCTKYLTRLLATRYYPREFVYRKKWGFGIPVKRWIRGELRPRFQDVLSTDNVRKAGLVNPAFCTKLLDDHLAERSSCAGQLWNLFVLHLWHANWSA